MDPDLNPNPEALAHRCAELDTETSLSAFEALQAPKVKILDGFRFRGLGVSGLGGLGGLWFRV